MSYKHVLFKLSINTTVQKNRFQRSSKSARKHTINISSQDFWSLNLVNKCVGCIKVGRAFRNVLLFSYKMQKRKTMSCHCLSHLNTNEIGVKKPLMAHTPLSISMCSDSPNPPVTLRLLWQDIVFASNKKLFCIMAVFTLAERGVLSPLNSHSITGTLHVNSYRCGCYRQRVQNIRRFLFTFFKLGQLYNLFHIYIFEIWKVWGF